jgi:hypothetical protein
MKIKFLSIFFVVELIISSVTPTLYAPPRRDVELHDNLLAIAHPVRQRIHAVLQDDHPKIREAKWYSSALPTARVLKGITAWASAGIDLIGGSAIAIASVVELKEAEADPQADNAQLALGVAVAGVRVLDLCADRFKSTCVNAQETLEGQKQNCFQRARAVIPEGDIDDGALWTVVRAYFNVPPKKLNDWLHEPEEG